MRTVKHRWWLERSAAQEAQPFANGGNRAGNALDGARLALRARIAVLEWGRLSRLDQIS